MTKIKRANDNEINKLAKESLGFKPDKIIPVINKGDVNQVFILTYGPSKIVLRLNSADEYNRFLKEAWCLKKAEEKTIPGPKVLSIGKKGYFSFMFVSFLPGVVGKEVKAPKIDIWFQIGKYANLIHEIPVTGFGEGFDSVGVFKDSWQRFLNYNIDSLNNNDPLLDLRIFDKDKSQLIKDLFVVFKDKPFKFGLSHGDLSLANVMVNCKNVSLFDWGCAVAHIVPYFEIEEILRSVLDENSNEFKSFLKGYGLSLSKFEKIKPDILILRLLWTIDKLRWAVDKAPEKIKFYSQEVKKSLKLVFLVIN